jgi:ParB-like chromosome segregation protein Spo0J
MQDTSKIILHDGREVDHGALVDIPIDRVVPNLWNPNELDDLSFNMLSDNIDSVGFISPIIVVPMKDGSYTVCDGFHRFEARRISGEKEIPCIVVSPEIFDEKMLMLQTVRLNKIRGSLNSEKFNALIDQLVNKHEIPFEDLAEELGFADEDEFEALVKQGRAQLPKEARKEYDKEVKKIGNNVNNLARIIEKLWLKYASTVPANFFILDYGSMRHLWITMDKEYLALTTDKFRDIFASGYKVSSVLQQMLAELDVTSFIEDHLTSLEKIDNGEQDLDSLLDLPSPVAELEEEVE